MLETLNEIDEEIQSIFTDKYTHEIEIRLGVPVIKDISLCDGDPIEECSSGLHVAVRRYDNSKIRVSE